MRFGVFALVLATLVALPVQAQECRLDPGAVQDYFFPETIGERTRHFYGRTGKCTAYIYQTPADDGSPWVVVKIEPHGDPLLGSSAEGLESHWEQAGLPTHRVLDWPVAYVGVTTGHEFVTLMGGLRVTVIVKNLAPMQARRGLADAVFTVVMPRIPPPCT